MKKLFIIAMIATCLITTGAHAQTYNATGSERQAASNDMGMYQLTLEAFRKSDYYLHGDYYQAKMARWAADTSVMNKNMPALVTPTGQIIEYSISAPGSTMGGNGQPIKKWFKANGGSRFSEIKLSQGLGPSTTQSPSPTFLYAQMSGVEVTNTSTYALSTFNNLALMQIVLYLTLADIAENSFQAIRSQRMNRHSAVMYLTKQIDSNLDKSIGSKFKQINEIVMNSQMAGVDSKTTKPTCFGADGNWVDCAAADGMYTIPQNTKVVTGFNEWTATFPGGLVIKNNYGAVDVSQYGIPWFSEAGIKGEKLSIAGSSDRGSSTSQKRGE